MTYKILPRIGSFEVSFKGVVINLLFETFLAYFLEIAFRYVASF
jgi:hypothetical protein